MGLTAAKNFILEHDRFVLAAHRSPDGDTLGSCLALRLCLLYLKKQALVVCEDDVPDYLRFLPGSGSVVTSLKEIPEAVLYIDCAEHKRTGSLSPILEEAAFQFGIDHHETNPCSSKNGDWVEETGATAELIYRLILELDAPLTREIADCLYAGITTDTGNFSYSNTTPDTFLIAAELVAAGIDPEDMNRRLFRTMSLAKARLISHALGSMELFLEGSVSIASVSEKDLLDAGAKEADCEGLIDYLRDIDSVEAALLLRESSDGTVRGSMRSKHGADVMTVAKRFGGGGHRKAAGFTYAGTLEDARDQVLPLLIETVALWKESYQS